MLNWRMGCSGAGFLAGAGPIALPLSHASSAHVLAACCTLAASPWICATQQPGFRSAQPVCSTAALGFLGLDKSSSTQPCTQVEQARCHSFCWQCIVYVSRVCLQAL